jgi:hypothetical protein
MVFAHVLVTLAECTAMAGELVNATGYVEANQQTWANQASAYLCTIGKYDFVTNVAALTASTKAILAEYIARYVGASAIAYNMATVGATFATLIEPEDMIQFHVYRMEKIEELIKNQDYVKFII